MNERRKVRERMAYVIERGLGYEQKYIIRMPSQKGCLGTCPCMHNLMPALLHRDLKVNNRLSGSHQCSRSTSQVENILQASANKFKLCDFGSATPVAPRLPSSQAEVQALSMELDRFTTPQYRAPEMVDTNLRRPIDEKSGK